MSKEDFYCFLDAIERTITSGKDPDEKNTKLFKNRLQEIRRSKVNLAEKMAEATSLLKSITFQTPPDFTVGPPQAKK